MFLGAATRLPLEGKCLQQGKRKKGKEKKKMRSKQQGPSICSESKQSLTGHTGRHGLPKSCHFMTAKWIKKRFKVTTFSVLATQNFIP